METNLKRISWREAATGGLLLGAILVIINILGYVMREQGMGLFLSLLRFFAIVGFSFYFARRMSFLNGDSGFSFIQSLGFILKMMLFAGVIAGLGQCFMFSYDSDYYYTLMEVSLETQSSAFNMSFSDAEMETVLKLYMSFIKNPLFMAISGAIDMLITGGLLGVLVSVFVKRPGVPTGTNNVQ